MTTFDPSRYGSAVTNLLDGDRLCDLGPGRPNRKAYDSLRLLTAEEVVPNAKSAEMAACCLSGLWLWHDYLDESHDISQELASVEGSYWHGIMHRREPDYSNAKYWYRRVGSHPIFEPLAEGTSILANSHDLDSLAKSLANGAVWDPYAFVDLCSEVARGKSHCKEFCQQIARLEWQLLFDYCYGEAS